MHGGIQASGRIPCTLEYSSTESGAHWQSIHLSKTGVLVDVQPMFAAPQGHVLRAQGSALFSLMGCADHSAPGPLPIW
jgi:hypothetical protein